MLLCKFIFSVSQQLDSRLLDSALVRRQRKTMNFTKLSLFFSRNYALHLCFHVLVELVGGLSSNLLNKATDFAGLGSGSLTGSVGSGLNVSNSSSSGGGPFLKSSNPFVGSSGMYIWRIVWSWFVWFLMLFGRSAGDSLSAILSSSISKFGTLISFSMLIFSIYFVINIHYCCI